jgi:hypothetical protein
MPQMEAQENRSGAMALGVTGPDVLSSRCAS